ncbi:MAG: electron transport complex subunit E [Clostridiales bacterium]|nr:electron transport complex subunit E [Clostridiales bacterium]
MDHQERLEGRQGPGLLQVLTNGVLFENPVLIQLLGMCPTLATSTGLKNAIGMGLSATAVLVCSNLAIALVRKIVPDQVRIAAFIVIIAGFVTAVDLLLQAFLIELSRSLGLFIPLIVVNCIILARAEAYASKNAVLPSAVDGLGMGLGFTLALVLLAVVREPLGSGMLFGVRLFGDAFKPAAFMTSSAGGFLVLGCIMALVQHIMHRAKREGA